MICDLIFSPVVNIIKHVYMMNNTIIDAVCLGGGGERRIT